MGSYYNPLIQALACALRVFNFEFQFAKSPAPQMADTGTTEKDAPDAPRLHPVDSALSDVAMAAEIDELVTPTPALLGRDICTRAYSR